MASRAFTLDFETRRFQQFTAGLIRGLEKDRSRLILRKIAFDFLRAVILKTPVDTGRARAGWTAFLDAQGTPMNVGGNDPQAIQEGKAAGFFEEHFQGDEQYLLIGNGVSYILYLEYGRSPQAPAGMVRLTLRELSTKGGLTETARQQLVQAIQEADRAAGYRK